MADVTNESELREKIARAIRRTVQSNTYRDERGLTHMGLGLNGVDEATDAILTLISPAGEVVRWKPGPPCPACGVPEGYLHKVECPVPAAPRGMEG